MQECMRLDATYIRYHYVDYLFRGIYFVFDHDLDFYVVVNSGFALINGYFIEILSL